MSEVWKQFDKNKAKNGKAQCNACGEWISMAGGTTNLRNHLKRKHPLLSTPNSKRTTTMDEYLKKPVNQREQVKFNEALAKYIAKDFRPFNTVESAAFREMIRAANLSIDVPGRKAIKTVVLHLYTDLMNSMTEELKAVEFLSLTTDIWTSTSQCSYISLTAHFIDDEWNLQSRLLATAEFSERHTGVNIAQKIGEILSRFGLPKSRITATVTDNARNMIVGIEEIQLRRLPCLAHSIQLSVSKGLEISSRLTEKCRKIVGHFKHSSLATSSLQSWQKRLQLPEHRLIQDVVTRWNSTLDMIERLLEQRLAISAALHSANNTAASMELSSTDWEHLNGLVPILKPFKLATEAMSGESYVSSSLTLPCVFQLVNETKEMEEKSKGMLKNTCRAILNDLQSRYPINNMPDEYAFASLLDPRFKNLPFFDEEKRKYLHNSLRNMISETVETDKIDTPSISGIDEFPASKRCKTSAMVELLSKLCQPSASTSEFELDHQKQVTGYLTEPVNNTEPLCWWRENSKRFPTVASVARKYLLIPATSVPSERIFSASGNIVTSQRSCLKPSSVEMLTFLNSNL